MGHNAFCASKRPSIMWRVSRHQLLEATSKANKPTWLHTTLTHVYYTTSNCPAFGGDWWSNRDRYQGLIQNWSVRYLHPELPGPPRNHISVSQCNVRHLLLSSLPWLTLSGTKLRKQQQQQQQRAAASEQGGGGELSPVKTGDRVPPWATSPHLLLPTSPTHLSVAAAQLILLLLLLPGVQ